MTIQLVANGSSSTLANKYGESAVSVAIKLQRGNSLLGHLLNTPEALVLAIHQSAHDGNIGILQALLNAGVDLNISDSLGTTPLMKAALNKQLAVVQALASYPSCLVNATNKVSVTCIDRL